jgi:hypothetical protein
VPRPHLGALPAVGAANGARCTSSSPGPAGLTLEAVVTMGFVTALLALTLIDYDHQLLCPT